MSGRDKGGNVKGKVKSRSSHAVLNLNVLALVYSLFGSRYGIFGRQSVAIG